jgi:hypothetical protein
MTRAILLAPALALLCVPVAHAGDKLAGQIGSFECGDNCYLTIVTDEGTDLTGLCVAPECEPWNAEVAIPEDLIGADVVVTVGTADQTDAAGTVMGSFVAFYEVVFAD